MNDPNGFDPNERELRLLLVGACVFSFLYITTYLAALAIHKLWS